MRAKTQETGKHLKSAFRFKKWFALQFCRGVGTEKEIRR